MSIRCPCWTLLIPLLLGIYIKVYLSAVELSPETTFTVEETIRARGYTHEKHEVITPDGYILAIYRVIGQKKGGHPVLMLPANKHSAHSFIMNMGTQAPAFRLVDEGYDVWLGNVRGNYLSRRHSHLDIKSDEFWDFTIEEISEIDIPAFIKYIKQTTGKSKIAALGHSQGATALVNLASVQPEIADDLSVVIAWSPQAG